MADADRLAIALAFNTAHLTGAGIALGMWAGRGDWAALSQKTRDDAGRRALDDVDVLIENLTAFRAQLAAAVESGSPDGAAPLSEAMRWAAAGESDEDLAVLVVEACPHWTPDEVQSYVNHLRNGSPR